MITVSVPDGLDLKKIFDSGQCFRWQCIGEDAWRIPSSGKVLEVRQTAPDTAAFFCSEEEFEGFWKKYFDLGTDYDRISEMIDPEDCFLSEAAAAGRGIRILSQDPWETLVTFIISQRKSIPAIRTCVAKLCGACSRTGNGRGGDTESSMRQFPSPEAVLEAGKNGRLDTCSLGYRLPYVISAAETVSGNEDFSMAHLARLDDGALLQKLMQLKGVGIKVAKCTMLFGFHRLDTFPVDVWIGRALENEYGGNFDFRRYSPYGGVIQQYIFAWYREKETAGFRLKRLDRKVVFRGKLLSFCQDTVQLPDGKKETWDFVSHPTGGACVVPVLPDGKILMERQMRPAIGKETLELPAGAKNSPEEDPAEAARRELEEETGYTCDRLIFLAGIYSAPSWCNEHTDIYLAEQIRPVHGQMPDEAEEIRLEAYPMRQLLSMISRGDIVDAKTVAGITAYAARQRLQS